MITQTYNLNLISDRVPVIVNCSQYDANSRTIEMTIYNGSTLYSIPSGATITVRGTKEDNTGFEYPCSFSGSVVSFDIQDQMTLFSGKVPCEIRITNNGIIGTCNFLLNVEETPLDPDVTISETDLPLLEEAEQNAIRAEAARDEAEQLLDTKQDVLTAGMGILLDGATISNVFASIADVDLNDIKYNYRGFVFRATNYPGVNANGVLDSIFVPPSGGGTPSHGMQIFKTYNSDKLYYRSYNTNTSTWGSWIELYSTSSLTAGDGINITSGGVISNRFANLTGVDLNTVKYNCIVWCNDACTNLPGNYGGMLLACFSSNNSNYGTQILTTYAATGKGTYYRRCSGGTWSDWIRLADCYMAGDTVTFTNTIDAVGIITSSQKQLIFTIPLDRPCNATTVSFTKLNVIIRGVDGYVLGSSQVDLVANSNYTVSASLNGSGIYVSVTCTNAVSTTNNTPINVDVRSGTSFTLA